MKHIAKCIALLLAVLALFSFAACSQNGNSDESVTTISADASTEKDPETEDPYDDNGYLKDSLPADLNYHDTVVNIMFDKAQLSKTIADGYTGDIMNDSLYDRLLATETRLGVKLNFIDVEGAWDKRAAFAQEVQRVYEAGTKDYDLVCAYNLTPPTMAVSGILTNLMDLDYIDFEKPWWAPQLLSQSVYKGKLFFCADNSSWNVIRNMQVIAYHKELVDAYNIPNPMKTVVDKEWTMDLLSQYISDGYKDLDGNSQINVDGDQFGLATDTKARMDGYFFAAGLQITTIDKEGVPHFALDDERVDTFVSYMQNLYNGNQNVILDSKQYKMFKDERVLFYETAIAIADQQLEFGYGMLPIPMFSKEQNGYVTGMSNTYDMWCIPKDVKDADMGAAILECLASEAYRKVAPAYFDVMLKTRYSSTSEAGIVFDTIRDGMVFDFGYVYGNNFSTAPFILVRNCYTDPNVSWKTTWSSQSRFYNTTLDMILSKLEIN